MLRDSEAKSEESDRQVHSLGEAAPPRTGGLRRPRLPGYVCRLKGGLVSAPGPTAWPGTHAELSHLRDSRTDDERPSPGGVSEAPVRPLCTRTCDLGKPQSSTLCGPWSVCSCVNCWLRRSQSAARGPGDTPGGQCAGASGALTVSLGLHDTPHPPSHSNLAPPGVVASQPPGELPGRCRPLPEGSGGQSRRTPLRAPGSHGPHSPCLSPAAYSVCS